MICPHCKKEIDKKEFYAELGRIKSEKKAAASVENGKKGGRPSKQKLPQG